MIELRFTSLSPDGEFLTLEDQNGEQYFLELTDELREHLIHPRLSAVPTLATNEMDPVITVKDIQARLRSGESISELSQSTGWSAEKIEKFSGPILQERAYVIGLALSTTLKKDSFSPTLNIAVVDQLTPRGVSEDEMQWNSHRLPSGAWEIILTYPSRDGENEARWHFDLHNHSLRPVDDGAQWICGEPVKAKSQTHGMVYPPEPSPAPRLVAIKTNDEEEIDSDAKRDGVTKKVRIPSWEDIMFGGKNEGE